MAKIINDNKLLQLIRDGNSPAEAARKLGVTRGSVSKRLKALRIGVTKDVALRSASKFVDKSLDAMQQLRKINALIDGELDHIQEQIEGKKGEERRLLQEQRLRHVAELRKQIGLLLEVCTTLYNVDEVKAFQEEVLKVIGEAAPEVRSAILQRLNERRALRLTLDLKA